MSKKYKIEVRQYTNDSALNPEYTKVETIERVLTGKAIGNFNPLFCRYNKEDYLVHSDEGDLSDSFRREESYAECLYIKIK